MPESPAPRLPFGHGKSSPALPKLPAAPPPKTAPAAPKAAPTAAAPKAPPAPAFEVVEEADGGFEVVEEAPPVRKSAIAAKKAAREEPKEAEEEREPVREKRDGKKKKTKKYSDKLLEKVDQEQEADAALRDYEWIFPLIVLAIGMVMMIVGAFGVSTVSGIMTLLSVLVYLIVAVPLIIVGFMLIGMLVGIDYGRLGPAILKIAAITCIANGIMCIGDWMRLPGLLVFPISCFITFGIFMTQFDLDTWEANVSAGVVNVCSFLANIALIAFIVVAASSAGGGSKTEPEDDQPVKEYRKDEKREKTPRPSVPGDPPIVNDEDNE